MRALFVTGILGGGAAIVFAAAAVTAIMFPNGRLIQPGWGGPWMERQVVFGGGPVPMPAPVMIEEPAVADPGFIVEEEIRDLPADDATDVDGTSEQPLPPVPSTPQPTP